MAESFMDVICGEMTAMEKKVSELEGVVYALETKLADSYENNGNLIADAQMQISDLVSQAFDARARSARWKRGAKRLRRQNLNQARRMAYVLLIGALGWAGAIGMAVYIFKAGRVGL